MSCHVMYVMSCHVMPCHDMPCHAMLCYAMLCYVTLRCVALLRVASHHIASHRIASYRIVLYCIVLRSKCKNRLALNQDDVFKWSYMSARKFLCRWASTIKFHLSVMVLVQSGHHYWNVICFRHDINANCSLGGKQQSLKHFID